MTQADKRRLEAGLDRSGWTETAWPALHDAAYHEECELCGSSMYGLHCKLICSNCGYRRDCSDP